MHNYTDTQEILGLTFYSRDLDEEITVKEYLKTLLRALWEEGEGFSAKRPLGYSSWTFDLAVPLLREGYIQGEWENEKQGDIDWIDTKAYNQIIIKCINDL